MKLISIFFQGSLEFSSGIDFWMKSLKTSIKILSFLDWKVFFFISWESVSRINSWIIILFFKFFWNLIENSHVFRRIYNIFENC